MVVYGKEDFGIREVYWAGSEARFERGREGTTCESSCRDAEEFSERKIHSSKCDIIFCTAGDSGDSDNGMGSSHKRLDGGNDTTIYTGDNFSSFNRVLCETLLFFGKSYTRSI